MYKSSGFVSFLAVMAVGLTGLFVGINYIEGSKHREFMSHLNVIMECRKTVDASKADHICGPVPTWENYTNK